MRPPAPPPPVLTGFSGLGFWNTETPFTPSYGPVLQSTSTRRFLVLPRLPSVGKWIHDRRCECFPPETTPHPLLPVWNGPRVELDPRLWSVSSSPQIPPDTVDCRVSGGTTHLNQSGLWVRLQVTLRLPGPYLTHSPCVWGKRTCECPLTSTDGGAGEGSVFKEAVDGEGVRSPGVNYYWENTFCLRTLNGRTPTIHNPNPLVKIKVGLTQVDRRPLPHPPLRLSPSSKPGHESCLRRRF